MDIHSLIVGGGPVASLIVLRSRATKNEDRKELPIKIGSVEAASISAGIQNERPSGRPLAHDLVIDAITTLGGTVDAVTINGVRGTTFFASLQITNAAGQHIELDCRPSDAIAVAVRTSVPLFVESDVLDRATLPDFTGVKRREEQARIDEFHSFVESVSPEDFDGPSSSGGLD